MEMFTREVLTYGKQSDFREKHKQELPFLGIFTISYHHNT